MKTDLFPAHIRTLRGALPYAIASALFGLVVYFRMIEARSHGLLDAAL